MSIQENAPPNQSTNTPSIGTFTFLEMGAYGPPFVRNHFIQKDGIEPFRKKHNNTGLYRSAYWYNSTDPYTSWLFSDLYFDFDSEDDIEKAREDLLFVIWKLHLTSTFGLPMESFRIYFSGKKGFHLIVPWQYIGIQPHPKLDELFKWIALEMYEQSVHETVDLVVYERRRLWRMENSKHPETGLYKIPLNYHEVSELTLEEIAHLAQNPRVLTYPQPIFVPQARREYERYAKELQEAEKRRRERWANRPPRKPFEEGEMPDFVKKLIEDGPVKGYRNETAAALTSYWHQQGMTPEEIWDRLLEWNGGQLAERELRTTMNSILKRGLTYGRKRLKALADQDMSQLREKPERKGVVPPWKKTDPH